MGKTTDKPRPVHVKQLLENVRACCLLTAQLDETKAAKRREARAYLALFKQITGRAPTSEELVHMIGGLAMTSIPGDATQSE